MKKVFYSLLVLTGIFVAVSLTSCKKKTTSSPVPIESTATIKGKVQADLDLTNALFEKAPSGTRVIAIIDAEDLIDNPDPLISYGSIEYSGTINSEGEYTISVAAGTKPVNVTIICDDFVYTQIISATNSTRKVYSGPTSGTTVYKDQIKWADLNYTTP